LKTLMKNMAVSFATGASFTAGVVVVIVAYQIAKDYWAVSETSWIKDPQELSIANHELVPDQNTFTVRGVIANAGDNVWNLATVEIRIFAGQALVNVCNDDVWEIPANSDRDFELSCRGAGGQNLPDNISYEIEVSHGSRVNWQ